MLHPPSTQGPASTRQLRIVAAAAAVGLPAAFLLESAPAAAVLGAVLLISGLGCLRRDPVGALALLPAAALLGPIVRVELPGFQLQLGDLYLGALAFWWVAIDGRRLRLPANAGLVGALLLMVMVCWVLSRDAIASAVGMIAILELLLVWLLTVTIVQSDEDAWRIVRAWAATIGLCSAFVIAAYALGRPLLLSTDAAFREGFAAQLARSDAFYRATFFVVGFIFPLCSAILFSIALLFYSALPTRARLGWGVALIVMLLALVLMGNQTTMVGLAVGCALLPILWPERRQRLRGLARSAVFAAVGLGAGLFILNLVMPVGQLLALRERLGDPESLLQRVWVWEQVVRFAVLSPRVLLLGMGPDHTIRRLDDPVVQELFYAGGVQQQAVDSGYLYVLINFGLPALLMAVLIAVTALRQLRRRAAQTRSALAAMIGAALLAWLVMMVAQQHGIAKPVFLLAQMIAIGSIVSRPPALSSADAAA